MKRTFDLNPQDLEQHRADAPPVPQPVDAAHARQRLLDAALDLFGTRGFGETSVRDLALAAHVNLAAVNYYFGSKENLRLEALRYGFAPTVDVADQLFRYYEEARLQGTSSAAEEALRRYVQLFLSQVLAEDHKHWNMDLREQLAPGPAFEMAMTDYLEPLGRGLVGIVSLLLPTVPEPKRGLCVRSIIGQCVHLRFAHGIARYFDTKAGNHGKPSLIEESASHIAEFSIQALRGMRSAAEKQPGKTFTTPIGRNARKGK